MKANKIQNQLINECIRLKFGRAHKAMQGCRKTIREWLPFLKSSQKKVRTEAAKTIAEMKWYIQVLHASAKLA
jgi:hypothetical protein